MHNINTFEGGWGLDTNTTSEKVSKSMNLSIAGASGF